jgi:type IX secretion system PorP/SprF family membrane protein
MALVGLMVCGLLAPMGSGAQVNSLGSIYFNNQYLLNPALSAVNPGLTLNLDFRRPVNPVQGYTNIQSLTGEYQLIPTMGVGLQVYHQEVGLFREINAKGTYSYHLALGNRGQILHFGLSAGIKRLQLGSDNGDPGDPLVAEFNDRGVEFDGDFGVAYTDSRISLQATVLGLPGYFNSNQAERAARSMLFAGASYKFKFGPEGNTVGFEPKICMHVAKNIDPVYDFGGNVAFIDGKLNFFGMFHSTNRVTLGFGVNVKSRFALMGVYSTESSAFQSYTGGIFELGLKYVLPDAR